MIDKLVYTFRTFPFIDELHQIVKDVFILSKIKNDLKSICLKIQTENPSIIIGIAKSETKISTIEKITINEFHKSGKVNKDLDLNEIYMDIPQKNIFKINDKPTKSFCNYSMFSIKTFLLQNKLDIPFIFIHVTEMDMNKLQKFMYEEHFLKEHISYT